MHVQSCCFAHKTNCFLTLLLSSSTLPKVLLCATLNRLARAGTKQNYLEMNNASEINPNSNLTCVGSKIIMVDMVKVRQKRHLLEVNP